MAQALVADQRVPGLAMAIVQDGRILSRRAATASPTCSAAAPVDAHTVFRLASLSKAFAGTMTGLLVSEGALRWDSRVTDYMPALPAVASPARRSKLTVADVLSQRVGLTHNTYDRDLEANVDYRSLVQKLAVRADELRARRVLRLPEHRLQPDRRRRVRRHRRVLCAEVAQRIFKPLGMNDASYGLEGIEYSARWAKPHVRGRGGWVSLMPKPSYYRVAPAAGVNASISDMAQWLIAQTGHRPDVLPAVAAGDAACAGDRYAQRTARLVMARASASTPPATRMGWRVYDYAGPSRACSMAARCRAIAAWSRCVPERDLGIAILWNSESSLPSGLLPTILDSAIGLTPGTGWTTKPRARRCMPREPQPRAPGMDASTAEAMPE